MQNAYRIKFKPLQKRTLAFFRGAIFCLATRYALVLKPFLLLADAADMAEWASEGVFTAARVEESARPAGPAIVHCRADA